MNGLRWKRQRIFKYVGTIGELHEKLFGLEDSPDLVAILLKRTAEWYKCGFYVDVEPWLRRQLVETVDTIVEIK